VLLRDSVIASVGAPVPRCSHGQLHDAVLAQGFTADWPGSAGQLHRCPATLLLQRDGSCTLLAAVTPAEAVNGLQSAAERIALRERCRGACRGAGFTVWAT
jgi:hypothetical protein